MVAVDFADEGGGKEDLALQDNQPLEIEQRFSNPFAIHHLIPTLWLFTESDFATFVIPDTCFGVSGALAGPLLTTNSQPELVQILRQTVLALLFNWANLLVFDLANQGTIESVLEDSINKPWRPIPTGRITVHQTRMLLMWCLPAVLAFNWWLGGWVETSLLFHLTWMYNHLGGGERSFITRNVIIAFAFGLYNAGSLRIAAGLEHSISLTGYYWVALVSCVILTTMHVQDMKDQVGDALRGRKTCPLVLGDYVARWTIAIPVAVWSIACPAFFNLGINGYLWPCGLGMLIILRILLLRDKRHDRNTWKLWTAWTALLYTLPLVTRPSALDPLGLVFSST